MSNKNELLKRAQELATSKQAATTSRDNAQEQLMRLASKKANA